MPLPSNLLQAIAAPNGGQVVLILGAGCSVDPPTSLPVGRRASLDAHQKLLDDNVLQPGECAHPDDLSALADTVWVKTGSQNDLVDRLPKGDFQMAKPNVGYLLAAALLREQSLLAVITLNFDLAATHALVELGGRDVDILNGPSAGVPGMTNLIYLHRNANSPNDEWILRTASLEDDWAGRWEELITQRVMTAPYSVFVGFGSPAGVLVASLKRIRESNVNSTAYVIGRGTAEQSPFLALLGLPAGNYRQSTWQEFMEALSARVVKDHKARLIAACEEVRTENGWEAEDVSNLCQRIAAASLTLEESGYKRVEHVELSELNNPAVRVFEDLYNIVAVAVYNTWAELDANWNGMQAGLVELISEYLDQSEAKAWDGYLVLMTPSILNAPETERLIEVRYNTSRLRKLIAAGKELTVLDDVKRLLAPLLPLRVEALPPDRRSVLDELPSLLAAKGVSEPAVRVLIDAYLEQNPLVESLHKFREEI
jgi:hypothetical protein